MPSRLSAVIRALRPHQWIKNLLLPLPMVLAHAYGNPAPWLQLALAFPAFCLVASGMYVMNDLNDLAADRGHPTRRLRPFAASLLTASHGRIIGTASLFAGFALASAVNAAFLALTAAYALCALAYTRVLKFKPIADVFCLAGFYTLRLYAGSAATSIPVSEWCLAFALFFFLNLAYLKRYVETSRLADWGARGYGEGDGALLKTCGLACGHLSVLVLALYIKSPEVLSLYRRPDILWLICVLAMFWLSRAWLIARRGGMHDDPVVFFLKDRLSFAVAGLGLATALVAT